MMNDNILMRLMMRPYNDQPSLGDMQRRKQQMLDDRASSVYRNVGPQDLFEFPDRNTSLPDDIMRMFLGGEERI